jgi:hypothetical protein
MTSGPLTRTLALLALAGLGAAAGGSGAESPPAVVVAQVPSIEVEAVGHGTLRGDPGNGGRIVVVRATGEARVLTAGFASATEPDVSFDGERVVFAGQRAAGDPWCVWEMEVDGGEPRKITCGPGARASQSTFP